LLGSPDDIEAVVTDLRNRCTNVCRIVLTRALAPEGETETLLMRARRLALATSRLPSLDDGGEALRLAPVNVEDLLLRPGVKIDTPPSFVRGQAIIVTGGGGSIGSEICNRVVTYGVARLLVIENSEPALHAVLEMLATKQSAAKIEGRLADIRDRSRIFRLAAEFRPDIVFHAAALKHVPLLEQDWGEGVKTNVFGSVNVADAAAAGARPWSYRRTTIRASRAEPRSASRMYCKRWTAISPAKPMAGAPCGRGALRQRARVQRLGGAQVQGADRGRRAAHRDPSRHGALLHDDPRSLRPRGHGGKPCPGHRGLGRRGLRAQHGTAGEDR
jgi:NAD(P)-dependent dehydrogenase (short-subunit alcohol dehydrogenase family)